jgi:hypothetical protein
MIRRDTENVLDGGGTAWWQLLVPADWWHSFTELPTLPDIGTRGIGGDATKSKTKGSGARPHACPTKI